jgi:hypothetical protein
MRVVMGADSHLALLPGHSGAMVVGRWVSLLLCTSGVWGESAGA